jgi:metallo-beta-lactamase class B
VEKVKLKYPNAKIIIPGHGEWGDKELFEYTIKLFE